ncbi:E3 ubiquitin-protein ligase RNF19B isoform X1 [Sebastes umbrosus]|uniref:E3 ubiquitin-protein ligase RNF19B isoform X1 n=1 Tax=Sebastes umbrosus TaxID=72105 RepID=UPI00189F76D1|nr:E3 ubiquitin-protein ligase RNF19B isoform X1 [Sebastes umbrosus]XP_037607567.1 E3 ubiquitin-protein ligase RNF19B isoform X1 [Sebastes umbrosus]
MKRPKQQTGPLSFLNFFSRKPKAEPKPERPVDAWPREEVAITLTPSEHPEQDLTAEEAGGERGEGGGPPPAAAAAATAAAEASEDGATATAECVGGASSGSTGVLSLSNSSQEQLLDEHLEECPLCLLSQPRCHFPRLSSCSHRTCSDCLRQYLRIEISESRVGIACPQCPETLAPLDVRAILDDRALLERFEEYQLRRFLAADPDTRWCPAPDCSYAVIAYGCAECPKLSCGREGCDTEFCYHCRQLWHPNQTCDQARRQRARHTSGGNDASTLYVFNEEPGGDAEEIKACPRCGAYIMKTNDGSCNRMNCTVCACQFCWLCMQEITDVHYLSPSGCTFWGKKPWSQTRKVLWQVGMLLGAPVVISLIAGIAIPVIIVGIPIYMGRKVHGRCKKNNISGSKHYLTVASGVMMSVFVSPVIAAVTVGVGVPLMLTYVYGVVPMSLCRNGWCRPQNEPPETHKIQLEDLASYLLFSHVVSDHWTGQKNSSLSDTSVQEVRVSVQEVGVLPSTSTTPPELDSYEELDEATKHHGYTQQDSQSDCEVVIVPDSKLEDTQALPLREGTNIEVRVEIETHPRGARHSSLSSILSSRSLSAESLAHSHPQFQDYLRASELDERREGGGEGGGGGGEEQEGREKPGGEAGGYEGTVYPVFEIDSV